MAEVVNSLFGITPESLQAQRDAALQAQALQYAKLDPFQRATAAIYSGANRLGGAVGGMLGAQDPEMMRIRQRQQLLEGADISDPKVLRERATIAMQQNDYAAAQQLASRAMDIEAKQASTAKDLAAANREKAATTPADIAKAQRIAAIKASLPAYKAAGDETTLKLLEDELKALEPAEKTPSFGTDREAVAAELYDNKTFAQLTPPQKAVVNKRVEQETKKGTTVNVSVAGQKAFSEKMGELDAKRVAEAGAARDNAFATIRSLDQLAKLDDQGLISGSFASGRVGATNLLSTLGLASPADQRALATSQNYQKVSGDVILATLGGKLGAGFSNEDRKFIESLVPQLETSPAARRQLINFMRDKNIAIAEEATRLENYARDKDGLKGFQPKIPFGQSAPANPYSGLSNAELEERIKRAKAAQQQQK